jgi:ribosomal protein S8
MKQQENVRKIIRNAAEEISMQGFILEHEVIDQKGDEEQAKLDAATLYAIASKLQDQIAALLVAATYVE